MSPVSLRENSNLYNGYMSSYIRRKIHGRTGYFLIFHIRLLKNIYKEFFYSIYLENLGKTSTFVLRKPYSC